MRHFDNAQALSEGWDLFDVDGRLQLQRIDCPSDQGELLDYSEPKFTSDAHAIVEVATAARKGSKYHWEALHLIGTLAEGEMVSAHLEERKSDLHNTST